MSRRQQLLARIDPTHLRGLEIGALCNPVVRPGDGDVRYADHLDTPALRAKYAQDPNVRPDEIVPVRYVLGAGGLPAAVGNDRFDYLVASHVIEHVPDVVGFLKQAASILAPDGIVSLAVPDKRYTFDCKRETTPVSAFLEAHLEGYERPSVRQVIDHFLEQADVPGTVTEERLWRGDVGWDAVPYVNRTTVTGLGEAGLRQYLQAIRDGQYIDAHCSVFTPHSFIRLLEALAQLGMLDFAVAHFAETPPGGMEFFVTLQKLPADASAAQRRSAILASLPTVAPPLLDGEIARLQQQPR